MADLEQVLERRYRHSFGYRAGYLPKSRAGVDQWHHEVKKKIAAAPHHAYRSPAVNALAHLIETDGIVRMYVTEMIEQVDSAHRQIENIDELLKALDLIVAVAPKYNRDPAKIVAFPVSTLFAYMMMTPAGEAAFRNVAFNGALRVILQEWCRYLDSPASTNVLTEHADGWLSQPAFEQNKLYEFVFDRSKPHWGFPSFNGYFHRQIRSEFRPLACPDDPKVIVSPNDGSVVTWQNNVAASANFWLKGQPYSLRDMLQGQYVDRFEGGTVFQSFLSGADYHRWHAPVAGKVVEVKLVEALMFSDAESAGFDPSAGVLSQGYEASVNTRGLVFIESPDPVIGMVCVIPIGITEISSVSFSVRAGDVVAKGEELGYFSYGGSSMAIVFQRGAVKRFTVPPNETGNQTNGAPIFVNAQMAEAN